MKIDLHVLADRVIKFGGPIVLAAVAQKLATGRLDIKAIALNAAEQALAKQGV